MDTKSIRKKPSKKKKSKKIAQRRQWDEESMQNAIRAVKSDNFGFKAAAIKFNVPRTSLFRLCSLNSNTQELMKPKLGRKPIFPPELEEQLVAHVLEMARTCPNFTNIDIKRLAFQFAETNNIPNSFAKCREVAGKRWLKNFKERHKDKLTIQKITDPEILTKTKKTMLKKRNSYVRTKRNEELMENTMVKVKTGRMLNVPETVLRPHETNMDIKFRQELAFPPELPEISTMERSSCDHRRNEMEYFAFEPTKAHEIEHKFNTHIIKDNWFELFCNRHKDRLLSLNNIKTEEELARERELENEIYVKNFNSEMEMNIDTDIINDDTDDEIMEDVDMEIEEEIMKLKQNIEEESKWVEVSSYQNTRLESKGREPFCPRKLEQQVTEHILITQQKYSDYSNERVAFQLAESNGQTGNTKLQQFLDRHKEILPISTKSSGQNRKTTDKEVRKKHNWDEESMKLAIGAIKAKRMGFKIAADTFNVPKSTLFRLATKVDYDLHLN